MCRLLLPAALLYVQWSCAVEGGTEELLFVQAIWRHGDRAPGKLPYPNDAHTEREWPRGWSQLTNLGIRQLYDLGSFFRKRYGTFIGEHYNLTEVRVVSTDSDRAIVSAQAMLRGLYPAKNGDAWMEGEQWQPLPFYSRTLGQSDPLLRPTDYQCDLYDETVDQQNEQLTAKLSEEFTDLFDYLAEVTGYESVDLDVISAINNIQREIIHGMKQPAWTARVWQSHGNLTTLELMSELHRIGRMSEFNSPQKAKLRGGLLLGDWLSRALRVASETQKKPTKMMLYSAHDGTVAALLFAMGISNGLIVPYAGCLIMEIYRNSRYEVEARMLYKNETSSDTVRTLVIPRCEKSCLVKKLVKLLSPQSFFNDGVLEKQCKQNYKPHGTSESQGANGFF